MRFTSYLTIALLALFLTACENRGPNRDASSGKSAEELRNETSADVDARKDNAKVEKEDYENRVQSYIDKQDARIDELKAKAKNQRGSARVRTDREVNRLEKDRDAVKARLDDIKSASAESWKDIRSDLDKMMSNKPKIEKKD